MFRIFLKKKLYAGEDAEQPVEKTPRLRNRRMAERYPVDQKHLTVMNDQDILAIRDMSLRGFSSEVSERAFERFGKDDVYSARMRYHGKLHDFDLKVAWKNGRTVGFELQDPSMETVLFFQGLIRPMQLAGSLSIVDSSFMQAHEGLLWYHGEGIDLHIWSDDESGLSAWQMVADDQVIEWSAVHGIKTGVLKQEPSDLGILEPGEVTRVIDAEPSKQRLRFAADIIHSGTFPEQGELARSLEELDLAI